MRLYLDTFTGISPRLPYVALLSQFSLENYFHSDGLQTPGNAPQTLQGQSVIPHILLIHTIRGILVMECTRMPFQKFLLRRAQARTALCNFFLALV
jgi:hypothetical protein